MPEISEYGPIVGKGIIKESCLLAEKLKGKKYRILTQPLLEEA